jgi:hypothetical protein
VGEADDWAANGMVRPAQLVFRILFLFVLFLKNNKLFIRNINKYIFNISKNHNNYTRIVYN